MSYPDPQTTLPPQSFPSPPFSGGDAGGFWPQYVVVDEQPPNGFTQYDQQQQFKRQRSLEQGTNFPSFQPMNPRTNPPPNGAVGKGTSHIFYKTRLCAQFRDGNCRNGDHCNFAHGSGDLRHPPPNWQDLVREKDRGAGTGGLGDDQRMLHRMKICKKYYNGEECPYGDKCNFIHERSSQLKKPEILGTRESSAISIGVTGDARGGSCDFDPTVFWKTKLCLKWEIGMCPYGDSCSYAHGQSELRFSAAVCEAEQATNGFSIPRKSTPVSTFNSAANPVACAPPDGDEEQKALKWKLKKKLNRIYADWIDNLSPPDCSPTREEN